MRPHVPAEILEGRSAGAERLPAPGAAPVVTFYGGAAGALAPFGLFIAGTLALTVAGVGNPKAYLPILLASLTLGLLLTRDRTRYSEAVIAGMGQPILMMMIMAWVLASIIGVLLNASQFVTALTWAAGQAHVEGAAFLALSFVLCSGVAISTGTSFGTIAICGPILYPAGAMVGAPLAPLAGAIIGGAAFGDLISPISDTTIASALSQHADISGTVRSRLKYVLMAGAGTLAIYFGVAWFQETAATRDAQVAGSPAGLPMSIVPLTIIGLLLAKRHLLHGLLVGVLLAAGVGVALGLIPAERIFAFNRAQAVDGNLIIEGIDRAFGISMFAVLLVGLVAAVKASGLVGRLVAISETRIHSPRGAELWIVGTFMVIVLVIQQVIVAMLTVSEFVRQTGARFGIHHYRRANLLDLTSTTAPFILPYFLPVLLMAGTTQSGEPYGIPEVSPLAIGLNNYFSWCVLAVLFVAVFTGFGRRFASDDEPGDDPRPSVSSFRSAPAARPAAGRKGASSGD